MEQKYMEILLEQMNSNFALVLEGHAALQEEIRVTRVELGARIDHNSFRIDVLNEKIDAVDAKVDAVKQSLGAKIDALAADLTAHRRDTEAHGGYRVGE